MVIGIALIIEGYHGHAIWGDILTLFQGQGVKKQQ
jgi:hypothetical protein